MGLGGAFPVGVSAAPNGGVPGPERTATAAPHCVQKRMSGATGAPHDPHSVETGVPQVLQKRCPGLMVVPQRVHPTAVRMQ